MYIESSLAYAIDHIKNLQYFQYFHSIIKYLVIISLSLTPPFFSLIPLIDNLIFMQNLGLVCLQSVTLILEDDFNKQVTLSRGGQILTSPNQGFSLNGKKQCQWYTFLTLTITTTQPKWSLLPLTD